MQTQSFHVDKPAKGETALNALASASGISKIRIKDAMQKGAVWLKRGKHQKRIRRSTFALLPTDKVSLYYNADVLALTPPEPELLGSNKHYSVWYKPPGLLAQGSREGDHCSLLRIAEQTTDKQVKLVHRLDREAAGLMMLAHTPKAAATLSELFNSQNEESRLQKIYHVEVLGKLPDAGEFTDSLEGKEALTRYQCPQHNEERNSSFARVELVTGRKHQIRQHFANAGFPVLGDPQYGTGNKDKRGLQLLAAELKFSCPLTLKQRHYKAPDAHLLW